MNGCDTQCLPTYPEAALLDGLLRHRECVLEQFDGLVLVSETAIASNQSPSSEIRATDITWLVSK